MFICILYIYVCINRLFDAKHHYPPAAFVVSLIGGGGVGVLMRDVRKIMIFSYRSVVFTDK